MNLLVEGCEGEVRGGRRGGNLKIEDWRRKGKAKGMRRRRKRDSRMTEKGEGSKEDLEVDSRFRTEEIIRLS